MENNDYRTGFNDGQIKMVDYAMSLLDSLDVDKLFENADIHPKGGRIPNKKFLDDFKNALLSKIN